MMASPPGWYNDGAGAERFWDGTKWTERSRDLPRSPSGALATESSSADSPLMTFQGLNDEGETKVQIFRDRLEWDQNVGSGYSGAKLAAGFFTGGVSLIATGVGRGSYGRTQPTKSILRLDSVTGITSKHEGWSTVVSVSTPSMAVTWKMRKAQARQVLDLLRELVDHAKTPTATAAPPPPKVAVNVIGAAPKAQSPAVGTDPLSGLNRLVKLHAEGALTDAEFSAAKAELLGL